MRTFGKLSAALALAAVSLLGQSSATYNPNPNWMQVRSPGTLAQRPANCTANKHFYVCNGAGCTTNGEVHYCTSANTWTVASGAGAVAGVSSFAGRAGAVVATEGDYSLSLLSDVSATSGTGTTVLLADAPTITTPVLPTYATLTEVATQTAPSAGFVRFYAKTGGSICWIASTGGEQCANASGGVTSLAGTANQISVSASTGGVTISIPNSPTLPGTTTGTFSGNLTGNVTGTASGNQPLDTELTTIAGLLTTDDAVMVANGTTWELKVIGDCANSTTSKLLYNATTNAFSCGTDQTGGGGGGSAAPPKTVTMSGSAATYTYSATASAGTHQITGPIDVRCYNGSGVRLGTVPVTYTASGSNFDVSIGAMTGTCDIFALGSGVGDMLKSDNLSGLSSTSTARANLGVAIGSDVQGFDSDLSALAALAATGGMMSRTGAGAFTVRTITGTSNEITVTNGDGVSGAPTLSLPSSVSLASKSLIIPNSTSLPASCSVGSIYMDTDATSGQRLYLCQATNTWVLQGDGGGGGSITSSTQYKIPVYNSAGTGLEGNAYSCIIDSNGLSCGDGTVAGESKLNELLVNGTNYFSWLAPDAITNTIRYKLADTSPTAGQVMAFGAPSSNISQQSWVTPVTSVSGSTSTGQLVAFNGTAGTAIQAVTGTGIIKIASNVVGTASAGADFPAPIKTQTKSFAITSPATTDSGIYQVVMPTNVTITRVWCNVKTGTNAVINLDERAEGTPDTSGTAVLTSNLTCTTGGANSTVFTNAGITGRAPVALTIASVSGTPDVLRVHFEYTVD